VNGPVDRMDLLPVPRGDEPTVWHLLDFVRGRFFCWGGVVVLMHDAICLLRQASFKTRRGLPTIHPSIHRECNVKMQRVEHYQELQRCGLRAHYVRMAYTFDPRWWISVAIGAGMQPQALVFADGLRRLDTKVAGVDPRYEPPALTNSAERDAVIGELIRQGRFERMPSPRADATQ
jgi:hypothetical protein